MSVVAVQQPNEVNSWGVLVNPLSGWEASPWFFHFLELSLRNSVLKLENKERDWEGCYI